MHTSIRPLVLLLACLLPFGCGSSRNQGFIQSAQLSYQIRATAPGARGVPLETLLTRALHALASDPGPIEQLLGNVPVAVRVRPARHNTNYLDPDPIPAGKQLVIWVAPLAHHPEAPPLVERRGTGYRLTQPVSLIWRWRGRLQEDRSVRLPRETRHCHPVEHALLLALERCLREARLEPLRSAVLPSAPPEHHRDDYAREVALYRKRYRLVASR